MQRKDVPIGEVKAEGEAGVFQALASVFGNVDSVGDKMLPGAFSRTLHRWRQSGNPIPVILSHSWDDPMAHIGAADPDQVVETDRGLEVQGRLDVHDNPVARQVHRLMKERRLTGWSFGYTVPEGGQARRDGVNEVSEVELIEVGPTLRGANAEAQLQAVKTAIRESNGGSSSTVSEAVDDYGFNREAARKHDAEFRERFRKKVRDQELEQMIEEVNAKKAEDEKRNRPIQVKTFEVG